MPQCESGQGKTNLFSGVVQPNSPLVRQVRVWQCCEARKSPVRPWSTMVGGEAGACYVGGKGGDGSLVNKLAVRFWGTRGSIPTPGEKTCRYGGNTACVEIRLGETLIVCDGGSGMRELGADLMKRGKPVRAHLLFSHTHWDHIQGFPFFVPAYVPGNEFFLYDSVETVGRFHGLLTGQMKAEYFPVQFEMLKATFRPMVIEGGEVRIDDLIVRTFKQHHPGGSLGYSFTAVDSGVKVVYATDNEVDQLLLGEKRKTRTGPRPVPGDLLDFIRGADLLIADGQFTDEEYDSRVGWGHPSVLTVLDMAVQAGVKRLALFHHDPGRTDEQLDGLVEQCRARAKAWGSEIEVFAAGDGVEWMAG